MPHERGLVVDTNANNELISDGLAVQPLTGVEIEALKKSGANATVSISRVQTDPIRMLTSWFRSPQEIIKAQIEQHANYELKTEYSKEKYKKRKEAK